MSLSDDLRAAKGLTKAQREVLAYLADEMVISITPDGLGASMRTIGLLTNRGLIEQEPPAKVVITRYTLMRITDAGRRAIAAAETTK